ncbi:MAG: N-acetyltransferase [Hyphomicrobiaceae bacterium]
MINSAPPSAEISAQNRSLTHADLPAIRALEATVFGPGRFARTAYRIREGNPAISAYCYGTFLGPRLIASLRMTPIAIGTTSPHLLLGPLSVAAGSTNQGYGRSLIAQALSSAKASGIGIVTLVGDMPYYGRFGFTPVAPGKILFPGPVNPARVLACELTPGTRATASGMVTATAFKSPTLKARSD